MKWSWRVTKIAGIDIYIHASFLLLLVWVGVSDWREEGTVNSVVEGIVFILALFACIVFHELGHALTARRFGIKTRDITLWPIGGVASLESMPEKPLHEMAVALAGPAVNVVIASCLWFWLDSHEAIPDMDTLMAGGGSFLFHLMVVNIVLAAFNLLPAFPMDGGRVLRAVLAFKLSRVKATVYAARVGQVFALLFGCLGFLGYGPMLVLVALFLWFAASAEANMEKIRAAMMQVNIRQAMITDFAVLSGDDTLSRAVELTLAGHQRSFPVIDAGHYLGVLTQMDLLKALADKGAGAIIRDVPVSPVTTADINDSLHGLLQRMQESNVMTVVITERGKMLGLVTLENIIELLGFQQAMGGNNNQRIARKWM